MAVESDVDAASAPEDETGGAAGARCLCREFDLSAASKATSGMIPYTSLAVLTVGERNQLLLQEGRWLAVSGQAPVATDRADPGSASSQ